jgi:hypothetical protein
LPQARFGQARKRKLCGDDKLQITQPGQAGTKHFEKVGLVLNLYKLNTGKIFLRPLKILYAKHTQFQ